MQNIVLYSAYSAYRVLDILRAGAFRELALVSSFLVYDDLQHLVKEENQLQITLNCVYAAVKKIIIKTVKIANVIYCSSRIDASYVEVLAFILGILKNMYWSRIQSVYFKRYVLLKIHMVRTHITFMENMSHISVGSFSDKSAMHA